MLPKAPIAVQPREMYEAEAIQRFIEGLKLAESCARDMHQKQPKRGWDDVAKALNHMRLQGHKLFHARGLTRQALLQHTDQIAFESATKKA